MKILYVTTVGGTMGFFASIIAKLINDGNEVDIACGDIENVPQKYFELGCKVHRISCSRSVINFGNIRAIQEIKSIVKKEEYDIIHCHTPIASFCTRIACNKFRKLGKKVIYTAHGFHFYAGAPIKNWIIFYPVEWLCSFFTDILITINTDDYELAKRKFNANEIDYIPGVGIDIDKYYNVSINDKDKREEIGVPEDAFILLSVGELNNNKNHKIVLEALAKMDANNIHYVIAGRGDLRDYLAGYSKELGISDRLHLIGQRTDVGELYKTANAFILPSLREGLNVSLMEAMASGTTCIATDIRGNRDIVSDDSNAFLFKCDDPVDIKQKIQFAYENSVRVDRRNKMKKYDVNEINQMMVKIYGK